MPTVSRRPASLNPGTRRRGCIAVLVTLSACSAHVQYHTPFDNEPPPPRTCVRLDAVDARPMEFGGSDRRRIGNIRNGIGIPYAFAQGSEDPEVLSLVMGATRDALRAASTRECSDGTSRLSVHLLRFWTDGSVEYEVEIRVKYSLFDEHGSSRWSREVAEVAREVVFTTEMHSRLIEAALQNMARKAHLLFTSPEVDTILHSGDSSRTP